jgi:hypothetical protein
MKKWVCGLLVVMLVWSLSGCSSDPPFHKIPGSEQKVGDKTKSATEREWVIKWKSRPDPDFLRSVQVLHEAPDAAGNRVMLIRLLPSINEEKWLAHWSSDKQVEYLHPNHGYKVEKELSTAGFADDREYPYFLDQIKAKDAWKLPLKTKGRRVVVAVVDTGVDLKHPEIVPYLVEGVNLRDPQQPPQDTMGHGTHVAGVMTSVWQGWYKGKGLAKKMGIMPIKVMNTGYDGDVYFTAEGIKAAVQRGADVVVLSQGSWTYSEVMADAVKEAEKKGVMVVGAAGNARMDKQGQILYNSPLYYPAALPTVLGVGAVDSDGKYVITSNAGPGIDVAAPGESIWAAVPGGGKGLDSGTSFAAPQAAALAALLRWEHPKMTPAQVRNLIRQTAKRPGQPRWDEQTGFGVIDMAAALTSRLAADIFEPNDQPAQAMPLSTDETYQGVLQGEGDSDCFRFRSDTPGFLTIHYHLEPPRKKTWLNVRMNGSDPAVTYPLKGDGPVRLSVGPGEVFACLQSSGIKKEARQKYTFNAAFQPQADDYENNDYRWNAYKTELSPGYTAFQGTLHKKQDQDWYRLDVPKPGKLRLRVDVLTPRSDPILFVQEKGGWKSIKRDEGMEGEKEICEMDVSTGSVYVRVSDYGTNPVPQEYHLLATYRPSTQDAWEPNNTVDLAAPLQTDRKTEGVIGSRSDLDWYTFHLDKERKIRIDAQKETSLRSALFLLYDRHLRALDQTRLSGNRTAGSLSIRLKPGTYLVRVQGLPAAAAGTYRLLLQ